MSVTFWTSQGLNVQRKVDDSNLGEDGTFTSAKVEKGKCITYTKINYNESTWGPDTSQVLTEGEGKVNLNFAPKSVRFVKPFGEEGVTLYRHNDYCGQQLTTYDSTPNIDIGGVSSMIISGGRWKLYPKPGYDGASVTKGPGEYPNPGAMGLPNDSLQSIKKA